MSDAVDVQPHLIPPMSTAIPFEPPSYHSVHTSNPSTNTIQNDDFGTAVLGDHLPEYGTVVASGAVQSSTTRSQSAPERALPKEFAYKVESKGKPIVVLNVLAPAAISKNIPTFSGQGPIRGDVRLSFEKPETVQSVVVSVVGNFITGIEDEKTTFLKILHPLWTQGEDSGSGNNEAVRSDAKLQGNYTWTFALDVPVELTLPTNSGDVSFCPPQTFSERAMHGSISYFLTVKVKRGRLRTDYKIAVPMGYIPIMRPPVFPPLRLISYQEGTPLLGPDIDSDGWHALTPVQIEGMLFKVRPVKVTCNLFVANPLSYTRGSVIPLYMTLTSESQQAVDLLRAPKAISVHLQRRILFRVPQKMLKNPENLHTTQGKDTRDVTRAVWWSPAQIHDDTSSSGEYIRHIQGELHLGSDLKPSSSMPYFRIEYSVVLSPFSAVGLETSGTEKLLREKTVEIVTSFAPGPRAVRAAPPGYETDSNALGLVEATIGMLSSTGFF